MLDRDELDTDGLGKDELNRYKLDPEELNVCMYDDARVHVTYCTCWTGTSWT